MSELSTDARAISEFAQKRGISRLVHFTPFLNLCGMFNLGGIWPRTRIAEYARDNGDEDIMAYIEWNDTLRLDGRKDCINLSIQRINSFLFARFKNYPYGTPWCILEINPVCLQHKGVLFTVANAAAKGVRLYGTHEGIVGLQKLYDNQIYDGKRIHVRTNTTPANCPTSIQAEVLYPGQIGLALVDGLVFATKDDAAQARAMLMTDCPRVNLPQIKVVPEDFS